MGKDKLTIHVMPHQRCPLPTDWSRHHCPQVRGPSAVPISQIYALDLNGGLRPIHIEVSSDNLDSPPLSTFVKYISDTPWPH
jgi:hypothetical protein